MATFNTSFFEAGKGSAVKLPELDAMERSSRRNSELAIKGQEMKLQKSLQDKATFEKMLAIDPITAISTKNTTDQAIALEGYNNKWGKRYVDAKGELSFADQIEMQKDRSLLQAKQKKVLADQEKFLNDIQLADKDQRGYWDKNILAEAKRKYYETGEYNPNMLTVAPQSMTAWLRTKSKELPTKTLPKVINGVRVDEKVIDKQDAQNLIFEGLTDEAKLKQTIADFDAWTKTAPVNEVANLLDTDKNGIVDPSEKQYAYSHTDLMTNPIVQWAINNPTYLESAMGTKESSSKNIPSTKSTSNNFSVNIGGADLKVSPATKRLGTVQYGDKNYSDTYAFAGNTTLSNLPTLGGLRFRGTSSRTLKMGNITGKLKDYVADDDMIIIEASTGIPELDIEPKGLVAIPANSIQGVNNLPLIQDGKQVTLGTIRGNKKEEVKKTGLLDNL